MTCPLRSSAEATLRRTALGRRQVSCRPAYDEGDVLMTSGLGSAARQTDRTAVILLRRCGGSTGVARITTFLSFSGEHAALWLGAGLVSAWANRSQRQAWLRRPRPRLSSGMDPLVHTVGRHSFPSSHASSAAAAAIAFRHLLPGPHLPYMATAMCLSRVVAGVHYPSDVACGAVIGIGIARLGRAWAIEAPQVLPRRTVIT
jgi:undecaprenyl-diphosphatase